QPLGMGCFPIERPQSLFLQVHDTPSSEKIGTCSQVTFSPWRAYSKAASTVDKSGDISASANPLETPEEGDSPTCGGSSTSRTPFREREGELYASNDKQDKPPTRKGVRKTRRGLG